MRHLKVTHRVLALTACLTLAGAPAGAAVRSGPAPPSAASPRIAVSRDICQGPTNARTDRLISTLADRLVVTRTERTPGLRFSFPAKVTSTRVARIRALAADLCALPKAPPGVKYCAFNYGVLYTLRFYVPNVKSPEPMIFGPVRFDPSGCLNVTGLGAQRSITPAFEAVLGSALSIDHANAATFFGTLTHS